MSEKAIKLLKLRIDKLEAVDFDLEAWKAGTLGLLQKLLGPGNSTSASIESLKIDYSSWALRDATSTYNPSETCRKMGREILGGLIDEIKVLGLPTDQTAVNVLKLFPEKVRSELSKALDSGDQKKLKSLLQSQKKEELLEAIRKLLMINH